MRSVSQQMLATHFISRQSQSGHGHATSHMGGGPTDQEHGDQGQTNHSSSSRVGRVELLPVRWHAALHGDATGIDRSLVI